MQDLMRIIQSLIQTHILKIWFVKREFKKDNIKKTVNALLLPWTEEEYNGEMVRKRTKYDTMFNDRVDAIRDKQIDDLAELMSKNAASDAEA